MDYPFVPGLTGPWLYESEMVALDQLAAKWGVGPNEIALWVHTLRQSWLNNPDKNNGYCPFWVYRILERRTHADNNSIIEVSYSHGKTADHAGPQSFVIFKCVETELERVKPEWRLKKVPDEKPAEGGLDIRHVALTPGQDWLGNPDPLLNQRQIAHPISVFDLLSRWSSASGESMGALSERLVRFLKHGALHLFEPRQTGLRTLYTPSTKDAAAIEIDCAAASLNGWTEESQAAKDLSGLFADMAEVEALEAQYDSLKPTASDTSGQKPGQVAPMGGEEAEGLQRAVPTVSIVQRLKADGETNKQIAARYSDFFGFEADSWPTVYGRMKAFMRGNYKGNRRH